MQEDSIKIFVSHKSSDIELTKALVKLLTASLKINNEEIRCTSVPGFRLDAGIDTNDAIRKEVNETALLVCLLTPESLKSSFVLFELGARWGVMKPLIPLLAHGADFSDLPSPIRDKNAVKLEKEEDLHDLIDTISKQLNIKKNKITSYQDEFNTVINHAVKKKVDEISEKATPKRLDVNEVIKTDVTKILTQREIDGILRSTEGVKIAKEAGEKFYTEFEKTCTENSYPESGVVFNIRRKQTTELCWEADLYGNGGTARVELYIPATNRVRTGVEHTDDAHIRIFVANYNLFDSYNRFAESKKRTYEKHYYLTLDESKEPNWSEEKRADKGISTEALLSNIFLEFYEFTKRYQEQF